MRDLFPEVAPRIDGDSINERYTTRETLDWCKRVLKVDAFDLDVAACPESHHAPRWFGRQFDGSFIDGLAQPWTGRVWCNPPYDNLEEWTLKAFDVVHTPQTQVQVIGMLIPDNRREQPFWQALVETWRDGRGRTGYPCSLFTHSLPGRQKFGVPGNPAAIGQQSPPFGVVLLEWRVG